MKFKLWIHGNFKRVYVNDKNFGKEKVYFEIDKQNQDRMILNKPELRNYLIETYPIEKFTEILNLLKN